MSSSSFEYQVYKAWILKRIDALREAVDNENLDAVEEMTFNSPAGDGWGWDNSPVDFAMPYFTPKNECREVGPMDIVEAMEELMRWKREN